MPLIFSRICRTGSMAPWASVNFNPSLPWALPMPAKKDLYLVPASPPLMVACKVPRIATCSFKPMPAAVALAPTAVKASLIP
ncbi:hypothetical protein D3C81_2077880 [compost metagenome]